MKRGHAVAAALVSGLLLAASMPRFDVWPLAWVALVPLLAAVRGQVWRRAFVLGWLCGCSFYTATLYWVVYTITSFTVIPAPLAVVALALVAAVAALLVGAFAAALEWLAEAGISRVVAVPVCWVAIEWLRTFFPAAFPWALLGYSQYSALVIVQLADLAGVYGLSALLSFTSAAITEVLCDGLRRHRLLALAATAAVAVSLAYGAVRLRSIDDRPTHAELVVGVAQGNIDQHAKWQPENQASTLARYLELSTAAVKQGAELVVWPEAAVPFVLAGDTRAKRVVDFARLAGVHLLVGAPGYRVDSGGQARQYNEAWLVTPQAGLAGSYAKMRLVPFGEYVPWGGLFGLVDRLVEGVADFGRGTEYVVFTGPEVTTRDGRRPARLASLVCYEGIFPGLTRRFVAAGAEVLFNVSNDAWYGRTAAPHQLLAMVAMRAVENRVPVVRATNTGISAVVDAAGRIRQRTPLFEQAVFVDSVRLTTGRSLYVRVGDLFVYLCLALLAVLTVIRVIAGPVLIRDSRRGILSHDGRR